MHDVIIIGAGPAGLSAAFWCDELGLDTLVLERIGVPKRVALHGTVEAKLFLSSNDSALQPR